MQNTDGSWYNLWEHIRETLLDGVTLPPRGASSSLSWDTEFNKMTEVVEVHTFDQVKCDKTFATHDNIHVTSCHWPGRHQFVVLRK